MNKWWQDVDRVKKDWGWPTGPHRLAHLAWSGFPQAGRGDIGPIILSVLKDRPRHGYDIIKFLEERSHGFWKPSPGSVYPTLQMMEEQGLVLAKKTDGKTVYAITEAGRRELKEKAVQAPWNDREIDWSAISELRNQAWETMHIMKEIIKLRDPDKYHAAAKIIKDASSELEKILDK